MSAGQAWKYRPV